MENTGNTEKTETKCPAGFCSNLPIERKVPLVAGALIVVLSFLTATAFPGMIWLIAIIGGAMVYAGLTGNCYLTKCIEHACSKKEGCGAGGDGKTP
jgi:hypothetical protein